MRRAYVDLPLSFEANQGQTDAQVAFLSRGIGYTVFLTADEAVLSLGRAAAPAHPLGDVVPQLATSRAGDGAHAVLRMQVVGANPDAEIGGLDLLPGKSHYLIGNDREGWRTTVPRYAKVEYRAVYPGIDLVYYGNDGLLEYDFIVSPGSDPETIVLRFAGADRLELDAGGDLLIQTPAGEIRDTKPVAYQEVDGVRREISAAFRLRDGHVGFEIGAYDERRPLVIDPRKVYSTYLGGSQHDEVLAVAVNPNDGSAYVTGIAWSADFPTVSPVQGANAGTFDVFVAKLNPAGSALVFSTYLGGAGPDRGQAIAWDDDWGEVVVAGTTYSPDFPTVNPLQGSLGGPADAFVTRMKSDGSEIQYSTYHGGSAWDGSASGVWSFGGKMLMAGMTYSTDFPTASPSQSSNAGAMDAFVTKFKDDGTLDWSTYLGGSDLDGALDVTMDNGGKAVTVGTTLSTDFPTALAIQATSGGSYDAFMTKMSSGSLEASTYLGGAASDSAYGVATDGQENVYVVGQTFSTNFPTASPYQATNAGGVDGFVTKIRKDGDALIYSTYLGGGADDRVADVTVASSENAMVVGYTTSSDFPTVPGLADIGGGLDAFVTRFNTAGTGLVYSSFLGGSAAEQGVGIHHDTAGNAYAVGLTASTDFPTEAPLQGSNAGSVDGFVTKVTIDAADDLNEFIP